MMAQFWKTKQFKTLERQWEKKLQDAGFKDAEKTVKGERVLITSSVCVYRRRVEPVEEKRTAATEYFSMLSTLFMKEVFHDESEKIIMELTAEGKKIKEISDILKERGMKKFNRDTIRYIRRRYEHKWGIKQWAPEQMVSRRVSKRPTPSS